MIVVYNVQDVDIYVLYMIDDVCEVNYCGVVVCEGKEGMCLGLVDVFVKWLQNYVEICEKQVIGSYVIFCEYVICGLVIDGLLLVELFEVVVIYSFEGDKCFCVEFVC